MAEPHKVSDEMLMALADNELTADRAAQVRAAIAADGELARRFAQFAETRSLLSRVHHEAIAEPVPAHLLAAVAAADAADARVVPLRPRPPAGWRRLALAASVALMLGGVVGFTIARLTAPAGHAGLALVGPAAPALAAALERDLSGGRRAFGQGEISVLHSYPMADGRPCRDFLIAGEGADGTFSGLACREDGIWRLRLVLAHAPRSPGALQPAGSDPLVQELLDRLGGAAPLDRAGEAALIARGWR
jgi:hypothetical protein